GEEIARAIEEEGKYTTQIDDQTIELDEECVDVKWEVHVKGGELAEEVADGVVVEIRGLR
ncbi:MAG: hypothetical protein GXO28_07565, partial [Methanopyri archaeon]|nr:hypothetical protein [Methanopyri archaeon]